MFFKLVDLFVFTSTFLCLCALYLRRRRSPLSLPPGPKGLPLIGNLFDIPEVEPWEAARKWGEPYGPLVHVRALGTSYIFVNSYQLAIDLFEKRGSNYSSRPKNVMLELGGWDWLTLIMPYGDELRRTRQLLHRFLQKSTVEQYIEVQEKSTHRMLERLLDHPDKFAETLRQSAGETILEVAYGYQAAEENDPYIALVQKAVETFTQALGIYVVNVIPWLRYVPSWFPGANFKRIADKGYSYSMAMLKEPYMWAKAEFLNGNPAPSMTSNLLGASLLDDPVINDESLIAKVAGVTYGGGADTIVSALHSFFLAMVLHPEVQLRAQEELNRVVGKNLLPSFADRPSLPYVDAIVKETMRWQVVAPLAAPHTADEGDEYEGHFIPAGSTIFPNLWAMLRDPTVYPEPDKFCPERWLPAEGKEPPLDVHKIVFGIGRRICPGRHFADNGMFIGVASILSAFSISKAVDENGSPITPKVEYTSHFIRHPKPFRYTLTPRSEKIKSVIHQAVDAAKQSVFSKAPTAD